MFPVLAGGLFTIEPPGKPLMFLKYIFIYLAGPGLSCNTRDLHCGMGDVFVAAHGI